MERSTAELVARALATGTMSRRRAPPSRDRRVRARGLVPEACLSNVDRRVLRMDNDEGKLAGLIGAGRLPIYEPGLKDVFEGASSGTAALLDRRWVIKEFGSRGSW
jgi:hypothetical protein